MIRLASSKSEARRLAMSNAPMGALLAERSLVQKFIVAPIVREYRVLVGYCKLQLCRIGASKILRLPRGQYLEAVRTQKLCNKDRHIFIEV